MSPPHSRGPRRAGEREGVRQVSGHVPVSHRATANEIAAIKQRVVIKGVDQGIIKYVCVILKVNSIDELYDKFTSLKRNFIANKYNKNGRNHL